MKIKSYSYPSYRVRYRLDKRPKGCHWQSYFFSFLVLIIISETFMYPLKLSSSCTNVTIKISSYEEFFIARHVFIHVLFQNCLLTSLLKHTCGVYALMTFKIKSSITNLIMIILSSCLLIMTISFLRPLSIKMPTHLCFVLFPCTTVWSLFLHLLGLLPHLFSLMNT
jgi:hypothetical protein